MEDNNKKPNKAIFIIIPIIILVAGVAGWYLGKGSIIESQKSDANKNISEKSNTSSDENIETSKENEQVTEEVKTKEEVKKAKCYGTYYVNGNKEDGEYQLTEDGKYNVVGEEKYGVFAIYENTIVFLTSKHTVGPREEDPIYYDPKSYLISDDCSKITLTEPGSHVSAYLTKVQ